MADVIVAPTKITAAGQSESFTAMNTSDTFKVRNNGRVLLHFKKSGAGDANVTLITPKQVGGFAVADQVIVVPATTGDVMVAPTNKDVFNDANADVSFTADEATGLTVAAVRI